MLSKQENEIMRAVYELCGGRESCLVSPYEIVSMLPVRGKYTVEKVDRILHSLEMDDYFDLLASERKGEKMYVITLHRNGIAYRRSEQQIKRSIVFKVILSVMGAVVTFAVGRLLVGLFS